MKIIILGADGMLGHRLCLEMVKERNFEVHATTRTGSWNENVLREFPDLKLIRIHPSGDIRSEENLDKVITNAKPRVLINAIGVIKQRKNENQILDCIDLNARFPHLLENRCKKKSIRLIHFSTDCVFSGKKGNYNEEDFKDAVDIYGKSKSFGEVDGENSLTLRTSIVGWELKGYCGLFEWFSRQRGKRVPGYKKAIYNGVTTTALARLVAKILIEHTDLNGIFQVSSNPISKYDLLSQLKEMMEWSDIEILSDESFVCDRTLSNNFFQKTTQWIAPSWSEMLQELKKEWESYRKLRSYEAYDK